jgi:carbamoylphosphate synthase large subunit
MMKPHVVLLGSAGTGTAFAAAVALRRSWSQSVGIVAMDINPKHLVTTSLLADGFEQVPFSSAPEFSGTVVEIIKRHAVDTYLPLFPEEIELAAQLRDQGNLPATVKVMVPPSKFSSECADKLALSHRLARHGVPVPRTASVLDPFESDSFFLKPKNGTGSRDARVIQSSELESLTFDQADDWLIQEICDTPEVTIDAFYDPSNGFVHAVCRERIEVKSGVSTKCRLFGDQSLQDYSRSIAEVLELAGSFCFQVMWSDRGWVVIDINPRPGAATAMCRLTGNDFFAAAFALCWQEEYRHFFQPVSGECFITRQYSEFQMMTDK